MLKVCPELLIDFSFSNKNEIFLRVFLLLLKLTKVDVTDGVAWLCMRHADYLTINMYRAFNKTKNIAYT